MAGYLDFTHFVLVFRLPHLRRSIASIDNIPNHALLHQAHALASDAFTIEWRVGLERMSNVINNGDIFSKQLGSNWVV